MNKKIKLIVWSNSEQTKYFLIPKDFEFSKGNFCICTFSGEEMKVKETVLSSYLINEEKAKKFLKEQLDYYIEQTKIAFKNLHAFSSKSFWDGDEGPGPVNEEDKTTNNLVNMLMDIDSDSTQGKFEAIDRKELEKKVKQYLESDEAGESFKNIAGKLRDLAVQLDKSKGSVNIEELIKSLGKDLFEDENTSVKDKKRKDDIAVSVKDSIAKAFKERGLESFSGGDFD